mmetsp:Transcript_161080/g.294241  ORF Transcript_161080/g.294241 Transcript_161080/m.294241 type:complete len:329 (+) Transcript_161080:110-1096(+)
MLTSKERRRQRARKLGFLQPTPKGYSQVLVPKALAKRIRKQLDAFQLHFECNKATGIGHHFLAEAILAARHVFGGDFACLALGIKKEADAARHNWPDLSDEFEIGGKVEADKVADFSLHDISYYGSSFAAIDVEHFVCCDDIDVTINSSVVDVGVGCNSRVTSGVCDGGSVEGMSDLVSSASGGSVKISLLRSIPWDQCNNLGCAAGHNLPIHSSCKSNLGLCDSSRTIASRVFSRCHQENCYKGEAAQTDWTFNDFDGVPLVLRGAPAIAAAHAAGQAEHFDNGHSLGLEGVNSILSMLMVLQIRFLVLVRVNTLGRGLAHESRKLH